MGKKPSVEGPKRYIKRHFRPPKNSISSFLSHKLSVIKFSPQNMGVRLTEHLSRLEPAHAPSSAPIINTEKSMK